MNKTIIAATTAALLGLFVSHTASAEVVTDSQLYALSQEMTAKNTGFQIDEITTVTNLRVWLAGDDLVLATFVNVESEVAEEGIETIRKTLTQTARDMCHTQKPYFAPMVPAYSNVNGVEIAFTYQFFNERITGSYNCNY